MSAHETIAVGLSMIIWLELSLLGALRIGKTVAEANRRMFLR